MSELVLKIFSLIFNELYISPSSVSFDSYSLPAELSSPDFNFSETEFKALILFSTWNVINKNEMRYNIRKHSTNSDINMNGYPDNINKIVSIPETDKK